LLEKLSKSGDDFFAVFVRGLIEREANEKWIDRSGEREIGTPLMSVEEHCDLLSQIALAMWEVRIDYLKRDYLEFVADYFSESAGKNAFQAQQIRERIRGHAMLVPSPNAPNAVEFDHDEFRLFFLGEGIASQLRPLNERAKADVFAVFRRGVLPRQAQHALVRAVTRGSDENRIEVIKLLATVSGMDAQASYTHENCGDTIIRLLTDVDGSKLSICSLTFGADALRDKKISGVKFEGCYFSETSMELTDLTGCLFKDTRFAQLRFYDSTSISNIKFSNCNVDALAFVDTHREFWDPAEIRRQLEGLGVTYDEPAAPSVGEVISGQTSPEIGDLEKVFRYFMRSTHISESVMLIKLGTRGQVFIDHTLPALVRRQVMVEIENRGGADQRRYRLGVPLQKLNAAVGVARGSFSRFLEQFPEAM
jgi:hypothetical protein